LLVACLLASHSLRAEATPEELFKAGSSAFQSGDYDGAAKNFETLLTLGLEGESLQSVLFNLAATYYNQKNLPKAESYFNRLLKEFPDGKDKAKALISLAQIQNQTGRKEEAEKNLQRAAECGGELGGKARMAQVSLLVQAGKSDQAEKTLQEVIAGGVNDPVSVQAALSLCEI
jgi:tetratricopeptide (TPR) repeat protein